ncbi:MAG TPA: hypothetical protein HPP57_03440 [Deltaproteobacteria bacterium]|jgi:hypothetical protein|nr:hypothetical protein [Deltaproteobacteria bacterium]
MPPEKVNPELLRKDPLAELLGPGSTARMLGDAENDGIPDEIKDLLIEHGLSKKEFTCQLKEIPEGAEIPDYVTSKNSGHLNTWTRTFPSTEWIKNKYGPGNYVLIFTWTGEGEEDGERKKSNERQQIPIVISAKAVHDHKKFKIAQLIKNTAEESEAIREARIESKLTNEAYEGLLDSPEKKEKPPMEQIKEMVETLKTLGIPVGMGMMTTPEKKPVDWVGILGAIAPLAGTVIAGIMSSGSKRSDDFNKMLLLMMSQGKEANAQVIEIMKANAGNNSGTGRANEYLELIKGVIDVKELINPQKETIADKIFNFLEGVAPVIAGVIQNAASNPETIKRDPVARMAKGMADKDENIQAIRGNVAEQTKLFNRMDDYFGTEQTDIIAEVMGFVRPEGYVKDPSKRLPQNERGGVTETEAEVVTSDDPDNIE